MKKIFSLLVISFLIIQSSAFAQNEIPRLAGRHTIFFDGGVKTNSNSTVSISTGTIETKTGFIGGINYGYWFSEQFALVLGVRMFGSATTIKLFNIETSSVLPVLFGLRFYPQALTVGEVGRVYGGVSLGQYFGSATKTKNFFMIESIHESVFGGEAAVGIDLFVAPWCKIGPQFSYQFLDDYKEILGITKNLSGVSFSVEFGFVL